MPSEERRTAVNHKRVNASGAASSTEVQRPRVPAHRVNTGALWKPDRDANGIPVVLYEARILQSQAPRNARRVSGDPPGIIAVPDEPWWAFLVSYASLRQTGAAFAFYGAAIAFHTYLSAFTYHWGVDVYGTEPVAPLRDVLHDILPNTKAFRIVPEVSHVASCLFLGGLMLAAFDQRSLDCFRTFMWAHGSLLAGRALSFSGTLLPDASQNCHSSLFMGSCHDLIYSGHVTVTVLTSLFATHFYSLPLFVRAVLAINTAVLSVFVITSHNHYTVDVVLAGALSALAYVAFTRHPVLVSLGTAVPARVLSKGSVLDGSKHDSGMLLLPRRTCARVCGTTTASSSPAGTVGYDGYARLATSDDLRQLTEHAHATVASLGFSPKLVNVSVVPIPAEDGERAYAGCRRVTATAAAGAARSEGKHVCASRADVSDDVGNEVASDSDESIGEGVAEEAVRSALEFIQLQRRSSSSRRRVHQQQSSCSRSTLAGRAEGAADTVVTTVQLLADASTGQLIGAFVAARGTPVTEGARRSTGTRTWAHTAPALQAPPATVAAAADQGIMRICAGGTTRGSHSCRRCGSDVICDGSFTQLRLRAAVESTPTSTSSRDDDPVPSTFASGPSPGIEPPSTAPPSLRQQSFLSQREVGGRSQRVGSSIQGGPQNERVDDCEGGSRNTIGRDASVLSPRPLQPPPSQRDLRRRQRFVPLRETQPPQSYE